MAKEDRTRDWRVEQHQQKHTRLEHTYIDVFGNVVNLVLDDDPAILFKTQWQGRAEWLQHQCLSPAAPATYLLGVVLGNLFLRKGTRARRRLGLGHRTRTVTSRLLLQNRWQPAVHESQWSSSGRGGGARGT